LIVPADGLPSSAFEVVRPAYGTGSLADLMPSVSAVLGVPGARDVLGLGAGLDGVDRVAVLLVDGLGAYQWPLIFDAPARTLTTGFPSTTPVSLVTLGTGVPPGAHGVLGFTSRMPDGRVLNHIRWQDDPDPVRWQPVPTRFETAVAAGVAATQVTRAEFEGSGLTVSANRGAAFRGGASSEELATEMLDALRAGPGLVYGYHPELDKAGHDFGVLSPAWHAAAADVEKLVDMLAEGLPPTGALLITADHGQLNVPADQRVPLSADLAEGVVAVAGEPRVRYLHVAPGALADVTAAWRAAFGSRAWVLGREEAIDGGWYGPVPPAHSGRIGDIVVICQGRTVSLADGFEPPSIGRMIAFHGSVTAAEMTVPLGVFVGGSG
jgi:Type I phosphodiesterase / nucleotide pyrophosphatase